MAFIDQVQDLTSLTASDTDELSQFLKDGVIDVTSRWLAIRPQDVELFGRETSEQTSNGSLNLNGARIISVIREDGVTSNNWRACRKISPSQQYLVTDEESLSFASKFNPAYMVADAGKISVFPAPGSDPNAFKAYYVNKDPVNSSGSALIHSHDDILYFPIDKVYLVVMYAGIRLLNATMSSNVISTTAVPPEVPSDPSISSPGVATVTIGSLGTAPTLTSTTLTTRVSFNDFFGSGSLNPFGDSDPTGFNVNAVPPDTPDTPELTEVGTAPTYNNSIASSEFGDLATLIDTDEDVELATAKVQEINALIQNELNEFNEANILFQATIQKEIQEDTLILQKYQAELAVYQAEVGAQVQEYTQKLQRYQLEVTNAFQAWQKTESDSLQQYQLDIQANLNEFNEDNAIYQSTVQEAIQNATIAAQEAQKEGDLTLQADVQDYTLELQKYQAEVAHYQAEINAEIQEANAKIQQYQLLYTQLKAEYDAAFMIAAPKQQPQQQVRA